MKTKYVITTDSFNQKTISVYEDKEEWLKAIDEEAFSMGRDNFYVEVYEVESEEEPKSEKVKIFGTQGRRDSWAYRANIPDSWGEPIFRQEIMRVDIWEDEENEGKYIAGDSMHTESYDSEEEAREYEAPSQYLTY